MGHLDFLTRLDFTLISEIKPDAGYATSRSGAQQRGLRRWGMGYCNRAPYRFARTGAKCSGKRMPARGPDSPRQRHWLRCWRAVENHPTRAVALLDFHLARRHQQRTDFCAISALLENGQ
jgi:hypothetical protein